VELLKIITIKQACINYVGYLV